MPLRSSFAVLLAVSAAVLAQGRAGRRSTPRFEVHEWGTFTTVAGPHGRALPWRPLDAPQDLPGFVHSMYADAAGGLRTKGATAALARLETPVLYFHADAPLTASVRARFPSGLLTEWYPQALASGPELHWRGVEVRPGDDQAYPTEPGPSRYYHAREASAAPLRVRSGGTFEREDFLFYRGVGVIELPLRVDSSGGPLRLESLANAPTEVIVFENVDGRVAWSRQALDARRATLERPPAADVEELQAKLSALLSAEGLNSQEAEAMVATWSDSWFEEGVRLIYLMPRAQVDAVLPLRVDPEPEATVRVMVGRLELVTPGRLQALRTRLAELDEPALGAGLEETRQSLGRFAEPMLHELLARESDTTVAERARRLLRE
jgi:hypothetical protein